MADDSRTFDIDGHAIVVRRLSKPLYASGFTKGDALDYYVRVAPTLLPHLRHRPLSLKRFPDGVKGRPFWEKDAPSFTPEWVTTLPVWRRSGESQIHYIVADNAATLAWLAGIATLELHPFLHTTRDIDVPTSVVFDLDPGPPADVLTCIDVACWLRDKLERLGLQAWPKVSGSKGLQLYVPLNTPTSYGVTQPFARGLADALAREHPDHVVAEMAKSLRGGKVFIDWSQNADFKTTVGVYSLRAKRERPFVSMPVTWEELRAAARRGRADGLYWEPDAALARIKANGDLFAPVLTVKQQLPGSARRPSPQRARAPKRTAAPPRGVAAAASGWRRSRQGSQRRFAIVRPRMNSRAIDLWLESDKKVIVWKLAGAPSAARPVTASIAREVAVSALEKVVGQAREHGTYQVIDGQIAPKSSFDIHVKGKDTAVWRFTPAARGWRVITLPAPGEPAHVPDASLDFMPPMLAEQHAAVPRGPEWIYEVKLDGYRVEALKTPASVRLLSRRGNDLSADYAGVTRAVASITADTAVLDGEVVALDTRGRPSFQALQHRAGTKHPIVYFAFDLLHLDGRDLRGRPLEERKAQLRKIIEGTGVRLSENLDGDPDDIVAAVRRMGLEGVIAKRRDSRYSSRRSGDWVKVKFLTRQEFVIAGYKPGFGTFESLVVGYYDGGRLRFAGKVRNGFTPHLRATLWRDLKVLETAQFPFAEKPVRGRSHWGEGLTTEDLTKLRWLKPERVAEVGFVEWTADGHLRHPKFLGLRPDKAAAEVVREG